VEQYIKLDLTKWLKVLRHLELLPRPLGQDWSEIWLQRFSGTITIWPKSILSDFYYILSDPGMERLARMIHVGQQAAFPKLNFISNRMKIERVVEEARRSLRVDPNALPTPNLERSEMRSMLSEDDLRTLLAKAHANGGSIPISPDLMASDGRSSRSISPIASGRRRGRLDGPESPSFSKRFTGWFGSLSAAASPSPKERSAIDSLRPTVQEAQPRMGRRSSLVEELKRQSTIFFDDVETEGETEDEHGSSKDEVAPYEHHRNGDDDQGIDESAVESDVEDFRRRNGGEGEQ